MRESLRSETSGSWGMLSVRKIPQSYNLPTWMRCERGQRKPVVKHNGRAYSSAKIQVVDNPGNNQTRLGPSGSARGALVYLTSGTDVPDHRCLYPDGRSTTLGRERGRASLLSKTLGKRSCAKTLVVEAAQRCNSAMCKRRVNSLRSTSSRVGLTID